MFQSMSQFPCVPEILYDLKFNLVGNENEVCDSTVSEQPSQLLIIHCL